MSLASPSAEERARKAQSLILQRLAPEGTQRNLANIYGVSESTVSRWKEGIEPVTRMLAQVGLKVVPADHVCVDRASYEAMTLIASRAMANRDIAKKLIWEGEGED